MGLGYPAELSFPATVAYRPVNVASVGGGLPTGLFRRVEANVDRRANGVVRIENGLYRAITYVSLNDPASDTLASDVG